MCLDIELFWEEVSILSGACKPGTPGVISGVVEASSNDPAWLESLNPNGDQHGLLHAVSSFVCHRLRFMFGPAASHRHYREYC